MPWLRLRKFYTRIRWHLWEKYKPEHRENRLFDGIYQYLFNEPDVHARVRHILQYNQSNLPIDAISAEEERALPGDPEKRLSGWSRWMLVRYGLAMREAQGKSVLDSCSGLGWGSYLVDTVARSVISIDIDKPSLKLARELWPTESTVHIQGSVLSIPLPENQFDLVLAMESIEHFTKPDIFCYLKELYRVMKPGGKLIASSAFPDTRAEADILRENNPYHLYILTKEELVDLLKGINFHKHHIYKNGLFFWAQK